METFPPPPGVMGSLMAGLDIVSTHISSMILPVMLDLWLWLGPRLSMERLFNSALLDSLSLLRLLGFSASDIQHIIESAIVQSDRVNVFRLLRTFPIGVPSLMADKMPIANPFGSPGFMQVSSPASFMGSFVLFSLLGWIGGGLYFWRVSVATLGKDESKLTPGRAITQSIFFSILCVIALIIILPPVSLVAGLLYLLYLFSPTLAWLSLFFVSLFASWVMVPLFFTPHGIFMNRQNALVSIISSVRMARFTLPTSGMFVLSVFLLYEGLNFLWSVPSSDSWMLLVGILGHAFIVTALLAASFIYYRDMNSWLLLIFERMQQMNKPAQPV